MWETDETGSSELYVWEAFCPACGDVAYKPAGEPMTFQAGGGTLHKVKAAGLKAAKDYCYQVITRAGEQEITSGIYVFRTAPEKGGPISFAVTSETGGAGKTAGLLEKLVAAIAAERPDFLIFAGDMVADGRRKRDWDDHLFTPFRKAFGNTSFYLCVGNHEGHADYMGQFLAASKNGYYDFTYGCAHFIALDSTTLAEHVRGEGGDYSIAPAGPLTEDNPQVRFLRESLEKSDSPWKFVYFHYPPYFSGTWEASCLRPLCEIFEEYGVDIVFTSHAIVYERSHPIRGGSLDFENGVRYAVVGGAGAAPQWFHHKKAWHTAKSRAIPHFVHIAAAPGQLEFQAIDLEGRLFDVLTLRKKYKG
jgi:hypothetical protein